MPVGTVEMVGALQRTSGELCARLNECNSIASAVFLDGMIVACARDTPEPVEYRLFIEDGSLWVSWSCEDRWLSQSIEADLMFTGDDLDDMIDEELIDLGWDHGGLGKNEHFRSEDKRYTFRSKIDLDQDAVERSGDGLAACVLAYGLVFTELGDMKKDDEGA